MRRFAKTGLLTGCAIGALVLVSANASAQSFNGTPNAVVGSPSITTDPGSASTLPSTTISLGDNETVINWTVNTVGNASVVFQPANTTALFFGDDIADFTVLNRIIPIDAATGSVSQSTVQLNGNVVGFINPPGNQPSIGGQVWFYSPTGIIVGSTAQFSVGSLLLTTHDIAYQPDLPSGGPPGFILGPGGTVNFNAATNPNSFVQIQPGAQISALGNPQAGVAAYVALVSPRIEQGGNISAEGNISYLAADQLDMTINAGLVDFELTVGTNDSNGIVHTGTSTGSASTSAADRQVIAMVALPRNDALTMLLSGTVGYAAAASAAQEGSSVVLSSGFTNEAPTQGPTNPVGSIEITASTFLNDVTAFAADSITVSPNPGLIDFQGDATLVAAQRIDLLAEVREEIRVAGDLSLYSGVANGGQVNIFAFATPATPGGLIDVTGNLTIGAGSSSYFSTPTPPLDTDGGSVFIGSDGGLIRAANIFADASGFGTADLTDGGDGRGGFMSATVQNGGTISAGTFAMTAAGYGGTSETAGGNGFGGSIFLQEFDGQFDFGLVSLDARGSGGGSDAGLAGNATGGIADITLNGQVQNWDSLDILTNGYAGIGFSGGPGNLSGSVVDGGEGGLHVFGTAGLNIDGDLNIQSNAISATNGVAGFFGQAGDASIDAVSGGSVNVAGSIFVSASALFGGDLPSNSPDSSPEQMGGSVEITANGGSIQAGNLTANANAHGLPGQSAAGNATGGTVTVSSLAGGSINIDNGSTESSAILSANGYGSPGPIASNATGGTTQLILNDGSFAVNGILELRADGRAEEFFDPPPVGDGFTATGGTASIQLLAGSVGTANLNAGTVNISTVGDGRVFIDGGTTSPSGDPIIGNGGLASGGQATFTQLAGTVLASNLLVTANGFGGASAASDGAAAFQSGDAEGGASRFTAGGGTTSFTSINVQAGAIGGGGAPDAPDGTLAALAGDAIGGTAEFSLTDGVVTSGPLQVNAAGVGGAGMGHASTGAPTAGGSGIGGTALLSLDGGAGDINVASALVAATGTGGAGGNSATGAAAAGGAGSGGLARAGIADGQFSLGTVVVSTDGVGGTGGTGATANGAGGPGTGGTTEFNFVDVTGPTGPRAISNLGLYANGTAGTGAGAAPSTTAGTINLVADAFDAASGLVINGLLVAQARGTTAPAGAGFSATITDAPFTVIAAAGIETSRDILITANAPFVVAGQFVASGRSFTETGLLQAGSVGIVSSQFINAERITSGDTTGLFALGGAIVVDDLNSVSTVTAQGQSIDITSTGALTFDVAQAIGGNLSVNTAGNLTLPIASSAGAMALTSGGVLASDTVLSAGGNFSASGAQGVNLTSVSSGGTTALQSTAGDVDVLALVSGGTVSVSGINVDIFGPGPLTFTTAQAENAMSIVTAAGDLAFGTADAGGALTLVSAGTLTASGNVSGGATTLSATGDIDLDGQLTATGALLVSTPGSFTVAGDALAASVNATAVGGISLAGLDSGGTTSLLAPNGALAVTNLTSAGAVTARGQSVNIGSTGALSFADLDATAGPLTVQTTGNLQVATVDGSGAVTLTSSGGSFNATGAVNSGGALAITGSTGLTAGTVNSGGTTSLLAPSGALAVTNLTSAGAVTARGQSVNIGSTGALSFADLDATAGPLTVQTAGNLQVATVDGSGAVTLTSTGGSFNATGAINSGGALAITGSTGLTAGSVNSGGTTSLLAPSGALAVTNLNSAGAATARGQSVNIGSSGALSFADLDATSGPLTVQTAGNLQVATVDGSGAVTLASTGGSFNATGAINSGGALAITGSTGLTAGQVNSGGTTSLLAPNGAVSVTALTSLGSVTASGRSIALNSPGALNVASAVATAGPLSVQAANNLNVTDATATGLVTLRSTGGTITSVGTIDAGNGAIVNGATGITLGALNSGGTTQLTSSAGNVAVRTLSSAGPVSVVGVNVDIGGSGALTFATAQSTDTMSILTDGNLAFATVTAGGTLELSSGLGSISATGNVTGDATTLTAGQNITLNQNLSVDGALVADAGGAIAVLGNTGADSVDVTAGGDISFASIISDGPTSLISSTGSIEIDVLNSFGPVTAQAGQNIAIDGTGPLTFSSAAAGNDLYVHTTGNLVLPATSAGGNIDLASQDGDLSINGNLEGGSTQLVSGGNTLIGGNLDATGLQASAGGSFAVQGLATVGNARVTANEGITFPNLVADGFVALSSQNGSILVSELLAGSQVNADGQSVDISSSGDLNFGSVSASNGNVDLSTAGDMSAFNIFASGNATLDAGGTFALSGGLVGTEIRVSSADIAIDGGEGFIGQHGVTDLISLLNNDPSRTTYIGGTPQQDGYSLDEDEARVLLSDSYIRLGVANADLPSDHGLVQVGDLALTFEPEGNIGSGGTIEISTPTEVLVNGNVQITTVGAEDTLLIDPTFVGIDTTTGQISLANANGGALGTLQIVGDTVAAATTDVLSQLRTPGDIAATSALLDTPGGSGEPLTAGSISISVTNGLYIQNTGVSTEFEDRRGFNTGSLSIQTASPQTQIAINGVIVDANGAAVTGLDTAPLVTINDVPAAAGGQFDPGSTINGCVIGTNCAFVPEPQRPPEPPASDDLNPVDPGDPAEGTLIAPLIELADTNPLIEPPLVDEPITGVGNDDLWEPPCPKEDEDGICRGGNEQQ